MRFTAGKTIKINILVLIALDIAIIQADRGALQFVHAGPKEPRKTRVNRHSRLTSIHRSADRVFDDNILLRRVRKFSDLPNRGVIFSAELWAFYGTANI